MLENKMLFSHLFYGKLSLQGSDGGMFEASSLTGIEDDELRTMVSEDESIDYTDINYKLISYKEYRRKHTNTTR